MHHGIWVPEHGVYTPPQILCERPAKPAEGPAPSKLHTSSLSPISFALNPLLWNSQRLSHRFASAGIPCCMFSTPTSGTGKRRTERELRGPCDQSLDFDYVVLYPLVGAWTLGPGLRWPSSHAQTEERQPWLPLHQP